MKAINIKKHLVFSLLSVVALVSCTNSDTSKPKHVIIKKTDGKYRLHVNGEPMEVKGVGMGWVGDGSRVRALKEAGGNSFRTWGARNADAILDTAANYGLMVALGIRMGQELHDFDYSDSTAVAKQFENAKSKIDKYKDHPNLLCWVVGNELNLKFDDKGLVLVSPGTYKALADVVDYIHKVDPNHPVTTAFAGVMKDQIEYALRYCPDLDFLSYQVYGSLGDVPEMVEATGVNKPYLITEYGPVGHWERPSTEWGREIEETSGQKSRGLAERIRRAFQDDSTGLNMGGYAFLWGQKQERTPTWYGLFIKSGEATASVDELTRFWSGSYPANRAPVIDSIELDGKNAVDNIYLKPGSKYGSKVFVFDPDNDKLEYKWLIMKEVVERSQGGAHEEEPPEVEFQVVESKPGELTFISPSDRGDYRLFVYVYDGKGKVGTANIPFYVNN